MSACPEHALLIQALVDGELDAAGAVSCEAHLASCAACRAEYQSLLNLREMLSSPGLAHIAPPALRARIEQSIRQGGETAQTPAAPKRAPPGRGLSRQALPGLAIAAGVAALMIATPNLLSLQTRSLNVQLADNHRRALLESHLTDIAASDKHVVKPWFNGKLGFAPPVPDMADEGFPLVGGRLDYVDGQPAASVVYRRRLHVINLFAWRGDAHGLDPTPRTVKLDGYSLVEWRSADLTFAAISDLDAPELQAFQTRFIQRTDNH